MASTPNVGLATWASRGLAYNTFTFYTYPKYVQSQQGNHCPQILKLQPENSCTTIMVMSQPFTTVGWKGVQAPHQLWLLLLLKTESILGIWPSCTMTSSFFRDQRVLFPIFPLGCFEMTDNSTSLLSKEYNFLFLPLSQGSIPSAFFLLTDFCSPHTVQTSLSPIIDRNVFLCTACLTGLPGDWVEWKVGQAFS